MVFWTCLATTALLDSVRLSSQREKLVSTRALQRLALEQTELKLAKIDAALVPARDACDIDEVMAPRGYLSKTAGCYLTAQASGGATGPPPSAMTLALKNFGREIKELAALFVPYKTKGFEEPSVYASRLNSLRLDNDKVWAREESLIESAVPAPLLIKLPYLATCNVLDKLYDGDNGKRVLAKFWFLETIARVPYFGYNTMIFFYETMGWWRLSSSLKKVHFKEDENEFAHLLIIEALGGDQAWFDRFIGQHAALSYYLVITFMCFYP
jgi:ubiquinol oxidase